MQSWVIDSAKKITLVQKEQEDVNLRTHARVKIARASLCSSDFAIYQGKLQKEPIVPARSALALISESKTKTLAKGLRVYISPYRMDKEKGVEISGLDFDGYLSDFSVVDNNDIYVVPEYIEDEDVTFIEDIAMAIKTCSLIDIKETHYVALYGATAFNIILGQFALYYQAIPIIISDDADALSIAENHGIYYTINAKKENVFDRIVEITSGNLVEHAVIDTDIAPNPEPDLLKAVAQGGKVAFCGYNTTLDSLKLNAAYIVSKQLSLYGVNDGIGEIEPAINMLATGIINVEGLLEKMYDFSEVEEFFSTQATKKHRFKNIVRC